MTRKEFIDFLKENGLERLNTHDVLWCYKGYPLSITPKVIVDKDSVDMFTDARLERNVRSNNEKIIMFRYSTILPFDTAKMTIETVIKKMKKLKKEIRLNKIEEL